MEERILSYVSDKYNILHFYDRDLLNHKIQPLSQRTFVNNDALYLLNVRACGVISVSMVLKFCCKISNISEDVNVESVFAKMARMHKSNVESIACKMVLENKEVLVPVGLPHELDKNHNSSDIVDYVTIEPSKSYRPMFSLIRGYDHRGSKRFFSQYDINADYYERVRYKDILQMLDEGKVLLGSIKPSRRLAKYRFAHEKKQEMAHLVLITDYVNIDGQTLFFVIDPDNDESQGIPAKYIIEEYDFRIFSNFRGTWIDLKNYR